MSLNGMKKMCYLVGQISPKFPITYEWRNKVRSANYKGEIGFIDPCANSFNKEILEKSEYSITRNYRSFGVDILPHKDYQFVMESHIAVVNMNQYDPNKPLLGSFFELAWYFAHPEKTVIAFANDLNAYLCQHPFVKGAVSTWCNDEDEAIHLLRKYFVSV